MQDTNRVAVAGISPGLSASETPGLGVAGGIIHIYRVAVAAKQPMDCGETTNGGAAKQPTGVWRNDQRDCGKTTNGDVAKQPTGAWQNNQRGRGKTTNGCVAKRPTGLRQNNQRGCGETNDGFVAKRPMGAQYGWVIIDADELPQPLRGNINKLTRYPASPGFRWRSTPGYIPQPLRG